jgi:amino acid adenylation domain-containing protein
VNTAEFVGRIRGLGVTLRADGGAIRCSAPKGILTQALQEEIARRKTEILAIIGQEEAADRRLERLRLGPMPRPGRLPLSFAQQRLWFLNQLDPGSSAYTIAGRWLLGGSLDIAAVERAVTELMRRHESLRTTFPSVNGEPVQRIADPEPMKLRIVDLESVPKTDRDRLARDTARQEAQQPFDIARGPLFRPVLLHYGQGEYELIASLHHIVADGWSLSIIVREVRVLYDACVTASPSPLPSLPLQYADFVLWQHHWLTEDILEDELRYWREHLRERPAPLELRPDYPRPTQPSCAAESHEFELPAALAGALRELGSRCGATPFMTLLAGLAALLSRYTGETDIILGTPVANRTRVELEPIVGFFANTLALRIDLAGDPSFLQILATVREESLGAYAHQHMPFEKLVEELQPERKLGRNPLFDISFVFESATAGASAGASPVMNFVSVAAPFDLTLFVREGCEGKLRGTVVYKRDLFASETIAGVARHYRTLLEGVTADPGRRLSSLPLLDGAEVHRLLVELNATATDYPRERSLHGLFEDQVIATPDAVAVMFGDTSLTYRELDLRANCLAHHLRTLSIRAEEPVGVWMERSIDVIVALLGILKAGGAYLPFDLKAPPERWDFVLRDANIRILLTQERMLQRLPPHEARVVCLDAQPCPIDTLSATGPSDWVTAESLAYVMYTSGSTGEPKGVAVTHRNVVRLVKSTDYVHFGADEVFLQLAPLSFDASTFEIWGALLNGGRLVIAPPGALSVRELGTVLSRCGVTTLWLTAGLFHEVVQHHIDVLRPLRQIVSGGDVLSVSHVKRVRQQFPECRLVNGYGPTEGTTFSCHYTIPADARFERCVPIGRPVANTRVYVLDCHLNPVPIGVPGELWIAGDGLARGYLNREELTNERFIVHRFCAGLEERLYGSGDVVRWRVDGMLEFIGRRDDQVKIRGYRVEPGEIEAALAQHPRIREVAVVARRNADGDPRLVAYIVVEGTCATRDLREFLKRKLPEYMVPVAFVTLDRMPLTPNGKVDRRVLPDTAELADREYLGYASGPSRNPVERQLIEIWQEVLSVHPIGIRDNFFDLGGHSLLAVRLFAWLEQCMGIRLPLSTLFETPTIEGLAAVIQQGRGSEVEWRSLVAINPSGGRLPVFAVPGVGGNVLCYSDLARLLGPEQPFYALQSRGLNGTENPLTRIEDIAAALLQEIRLVQRGGPYQLLGSCMGGVVAYEMAQQMRAAGEEVKLLVLLETWLPPGSARRRLQPSARARAAMHIISDRFRRYVKTFAEFRGRQRIDYLLDRLKMLTRLLAQRDVFRGDRSELHLETVAQANLSAFEHYRPSVYAGRVVLIYAAERDGTSSNDPRLAWRELIAGDVEIRSVPVRDSGQMLMEPAVRALAQHIMGCIESAQLSAARLERV